MSLLCFLELSPIVISTNDLTDLYILVLTYPILYKYSKNHGQPAEKKCSLQTTCPPRSTCDPIAKHCTSGQLGCSDDCQANSPCSLTKAAWKHDKFHVVCTDPHGHDINIYMDEVKDKRITPGTVCQTVRKYFTL